MFRFTDPRESTLIGIMSTKGQMHNEDTDEITDIEMFSVGFFIFQIDLIW